MALRGPLGDATASHRVYHGPDVDESAAFRAENAVVRTACRGATHVHVAADVDTLTIDAPVASHAFETLTRVPEAERVLAGGGEERVAAIPDDDVALARVLGAPIEPGDVDWRTDAIESIAVRRGDQPLYHSVPRNDEVRAVYAADEPRFLESLWRSLDDHDDVAVYPTGALATWEVRDTRYALTPTSIDVGTDRDQESYPLKRLEHASPTRSGTGVDLEWERENETSGGLLGAVDRMFDRASHPGSVPVGSDATVLLVLDRLAEIRDALGYDYRLTR